MSGNATSHKSATGRYAILIRHPGWIDRFARREPRQLHAPEKIDAWIAHEPQDKGVWESMAEAEAHAGMLAERFGAHEFDLSRYRFDIAEERLEPRWYLASPKDRREEQPIGSRGQL